MTAGTAWSSEVRPTTARPGLFEGLSYPLARELLCHVCIAPDAPLPDALVEATAAAQAWPWLVSAARRTGLVALLWSRLTPGQRDLVPLPVRDELSALHLGCAVSYAAAQRQLARCLSELGAAGITVIVLKGAAIASTLYPDPSTRLLADLDLLVADDDLSRARECLVGHGVAPRPSDHLHESPAAVPDEAFPVELHAISRHLRWWPQSEPGDLLDRTREIRIGDTRPLTLNPVDTWLHLACHGLRHAPRYWPRMAADLARLVRSEAWNEESWGRLLEPARRARRRRLILVAACIAHGGGLPSQLSGMIDAHRAADAVRRARIAWRIALDSTDLRSGPWVRAWTLDAPSDRAHELRRVLLPSLTRVAERSALPRPLAAAAYPLAVAVEGLRSAWSGLRWGVSLWRYR